MTNSGESVGWLDRPWTTTNGWWLGVVLIVIRSALPEWWHVARGMLLVGTLVLFGRIIWRGRRYLLHSEGKGEQ